MRDTDIYEAVNRLKSNDDFKLYVKHVLSKLEGEKNKLIKHIEPYEVYRSQGFIKALKVILEDPKTGITIIEDI